MEIDYVRVYQESTTSTNERISPQSLNYYPNPIDDELTIDLEKDIQRKIDVTIFNLEGKLIKTLSPTINGRQMRIEQLGDLTKGVYLLKFQLDKENYSVKFLKH